MGRGVLLGWAKAVDALSEMVVHARGESVSIMLEAGIQVTRDPPVPEDDQEVGSSQASRPKDAPLHTRMRDNQKPPGHSTRQLCRRLICRPSNKLSLIVIEDVGWLLLNDELISRLDLSNYQIARGVAEMAGYFNDHEGSIVSYEDFTVGVPGGSER